MSEEAVYHEPVLLNESVESLITDPAGTYIDCTLGGGGHSMTILNKLTNGLLYSIDRDADAIGFAQKRIGSNPHSHICHGDFADMNELSGLNNNSVSGILMDLGVSSWQIDAGERGFSFQADGPLDMRMDQSKVFNAAHVLNEFSFDELKRIFFLYGEEKKSHQIAKEIVRQREKEELKLTSELKECVARVVHGKQLTKSLARIFQAIRIEVNNEMGQLEKALKVAFELLKDKGRLVVISYHSLEDRLTKQFIRSKSKTINTELPYEPESDQAVFELLSKKAIIPTETEIAKNNRARSARMRIAEKRGVYHES